MNADHEKTGRSTLTLVCVGKVTVAGGKVGLAFREVTPEGALGDERVYEQKGLRHVRIGAVYNVDADSVNPRSIYTTSFRWLRLWSNTAEAAVWQTAADAFDTQLLAAQQEKKQNARKLPLEVLAPIRQQYWKT